jgi:hypothetical protein
VVTSSKPDATASRLRTGAAVVAVVAFAFWFTDLPPFTDGATLALVLPVVLLIGIAEARRFRSRGSRPAPTTRDRPWFRPAVVAWVAIVAVATAWEVLALRSSPRSEHPTISSFVESVEQYHGGRMVLFLAWLWLGWTLAS